jgi:hypothetical protein
MTIQELKDQYCSRESAKTQALRAFDLPKTMRVDLFYQSDPPPSLYALVRMEGRRRPIRRWLSSGEASNVAILQAIRLTSGDSWYPIEMETSTKSITMTIKSMKPKSTFAQDQLSGVYPEPIEWAEEVFGPRLEELLSTDLNNIDRIVIRIRAYQAQKTNDARHLLKYLKLLLPE